MNKEVNIVPNHERSLNAFDIERRRFGAWGVIKGKLLAEVIGEKKALRMFQAVQDKEGFDRLGRSINLHFRAALASVHADDVPSFIEEKRMAIINDMRQDVEIIPEALPGVHLFPDGKFQIKSMSGYMLDRIYGRPWGFNGALRSWNDPSYNNEATEVYS